jgi:16S rRNA G966 N2-methylase RsmD
MYTRKINYLWIVNLVLFAGVVFLGIEQASRGAEISKLENQLEVTSVQKRDLSENIFELGAESNFSQVASESGFIKPTAVLYFDSIETVALAK